MTQIYSEVHIYCDVCGRDGACQGRELTASNLIGYSPDLIEYQGRSIRGCRELAKAYGWKYKARKDICPDCVSGMEVPNE